MRSNVRSNIKSHVRSNIKSHVRSNIKSHVRSIIKSHVRFQKGDKGGMANAKMYTFLKRNIVARTFPCLHKLTHRSTFGKIYFL